MRDTSSGYYSANTISVSRGDTRSVRLSVHPARLFLLGLSLLSLSVSVNTIARTTAGALPDVVPGEVLLRLRADVAGALGHDTPAQSGPALTAAIAAIADSTLRDRLSHAHISALTPVTSDGVYSVRGVFDPVSFARALATSPAVVYAEPNGYSHIAHDPANDPYYNYQWGLRQIKALDAWDITTGVSDVTIAVLDTGIDETHPDLQGKVLRGCNFTKTTTGCSTDTTDDNGHGTYVAGIAAARGDNDTGIAGVDWGARLLPVKIADASGAATNAAMAAGIRYAADNSARVINLSLSGPDRSQVVEDAVDYALAKGVVIVAAAGNDGKDAPAYPADYDGVIAVGASTQQDTPATFSNYGTSLDLLAPGVSIIGDDLNIDNPTPYRNDNGTSSASPFVAGAVGLMLSVAPNLTPALVKRALEATADDIGLPGFDVHNGWGRLNVARAVQAAKSGEIFPERYGTIRGRILGDIDPADVVVTLTPGDSRVASPDGYSFSNLPPGTYSLTARSDKYGLSLPQPLTVTVVGGDSDVQSFDLPFDVGPILRAQKGLFAFHAVPGVTNDSTPPPPIPRYFAATGHSLKGSFREYWEAHGGLPIFGYPISEEFTERIDDGNSYLVQYFERARFELHPEFAGTPNKVLLGRLGVALAPQTSVLSPPILDPFSRVKPPPDTAPNGSNAINSGPPVTAFITQTGHTLTNSYGFLRFWQSHGGQSVFGYPISEEFDEVSPNNHSTYHVQYFERARLEYHPGADPVIQLGRIGADYATMHGYTEAPPTQKQTP